MIRQFAVGLALFLAPFAAYAQPGPAKASGSSPLALQWLTIAALALVIGGLAVWTPGATYVPAHMENGQFAPGGFK